MNWGKRILPFIFFLLVFVSKGQQPILEFRALQALENISYNQTTCITQDSVGFIWIGTNDGLFRFDGQTCYPYLNNPTDSTTIPSDKINTLFVDHKMTLWVATSNGLCRYNPEYDNFTRVIADSALSGMPGADIQVINEDNSGNLYLAYNSAVFEYNKDSRHFQKIIDVQRGKINRILFDSQNNIWMAASSNGGLFYFNRTNGRLESFRYNPRDKQSVSSNEIMDIAISDNKLWIATYEAGIDCYNLKEKTFKHYFSSEYFENFAFSIFIDYKNRVWICTLGSLKLYDPKQDSFYNYYTDPNNPQSLGKGIAGFFEDNRGNYWTIHTQGGVRYAEQGNRFKHFNTDNFYFWNTSEKNITAITKDKEENLWIGNFYNGIDVFNWLANRIDRYIHQQGNLKSLGNGTIFSIFRDSKNQMWIGSNLGGLQKFDPGKKDFESFVHRPDDTLSIAGNDVRSIAEDSEGFLWLAIHGKGVDRFDPYRKTFKHFNSKTSGLSNDYTFQILCDSKGNLWVATAYGLSFLPKNGTKFKSFFNSRSDTTSLSSDVIRTIHEDLQNNIWVGTPNGLNKYVPENQSFIQYTKILKNKNICAILSDRENNIWYSSNAGISKFDPTSLRVTNFNQNDGLQSKIFNERAGFSDDNNMMFFGGSDGIDYFDSDSIAIDVIPPKVILNDFRVFNKPVTFKTNGKNIDKYIAYARHINLDYGQNSISFGFQALQLINPDRVTYAIKLSGFDKDWIDIGTRTEAIYTNLKPGRYVFMVRARYNDGDWNKKATSIVITISPAWWMSVWFLVLVILTMLIIPFLVIHFRTKRLVKQQQILELQVRERTREIQQKNELLHEMNSTKLKLFSIISHDLRSPFNSILGFHDLLVSDYDSLADDEKLDILKQLQKSSHQVYALVENLLNWSRIQTNAIQYRPTSFVLKHIVDEKINLYQTIAGEKEINILENVDETIRVFADSNLVGTILGNLINNAVKFTAKGGTITINAGRNGAMADIEISDTGMGMTKEQVEYLFDFDRMEVKTGTQGEKGTGLGLLLCKDFIEMNGGTFSVESEPGKGSKFRFNLPTAN